MRISDWSSDVCSSDLGLRVGACGSQPLHHTEEDTPFTPPLPPVVQRLVRTIRARRITPPQPVAVDEDDPAQHPPIINPRLAMALGKVRLQKRHLLISEPVTVAHPPPPPGSRPRTPLHTT